VTAGSLAHKICNCGVGTTLRPKTDRPVLNFTAPYAFW